MGMLVRGRTFGRAFERRRKRSARRWQTNNAVPGESGFLSERGLVVLACRSVRESTPNASAIEAVLVSSYDGEEAIDGKSEVKAFTAVGEGVAADLEPHPPVGNGEPVAFGRLASGHRRELESFGRHAQGAGSSHLVHDAVMAAAQRQEVGHCRRPAVGPEHDMVRVEEPPSRAAGPATASVSDKERPTHRPGDGPRRPVLLY